MNTRGISVVALIVLSPALLFLFALISGEIRPRPENIAMFSIFIILPITGILAGVVHRCINANIREILVIALIVSLPGLVFMFAIMSGEIRLHPGNIAMFSIFVVLPATGILAGVVHKWLNANNPKAKSGSTESSADNLEKVDEILQVTKRMQERIDTLEAILDNESPDWRKDL